MRHEKSFPKQSQPGDRKRTTKKHGISLCNNDRAIMIAAGRRRAAAARVENRAMLAAAHRFLLGRELCCAPRRERERETRIPGGGRCDVEGKAFRKRERHLGRCCRRCCFVLYSRECLGLYSMGKLCWRALGVSLSFRRSSGIYKARPGNGRGKIRTIFGRA